MKNKELQRAANNIGISIGKFKKELSEYEFNHKIKKQREAKKELSGSKPESFKKNQGFWARFKTKRKAKGDRIADKIQKQREARNPKPKKKEIKDPKKVRSRPFTLG
ncbi:hypothetical protein SAMN05444483_10986 [Salegentibacter echinorum]|uniref:Uncharacterized protein n=1 Tax=Salegentibacter echinorum TaxID=1073325 RepID=A0A1M5J2A5_SALEC|nr:hypothetical protein [Salegentibacter echinorum]SHG34706.1 hypothetical protein SAMN05444483_10986 [Salegentibacter echinorum]